MGGFVTHLLRNSIVDFIGFFNVTLVTRNMRNMTVDMIDLFRAEGPDSQVVN